MRIKLISQSDSQEIEVEFKPPTGRLFQLAFSLPSTVTMHLFCKGTTAAGFSTTYNDCDWFKEIQTSQGVFFPTPESLQVQPDLSPALAQR